MSYIDLQIISIRRDLKSVFCVSTQNIGYNFAVRGKYDSGRNGLMFKIFSCSENYGSISDHEYNIPTSWEACKFTEGRLHLTNLSCF